MALNPKMIAIAGGIAALLFLGKGKKPSSSDSKNYVDSEDMGDYGEPVGPNGCKPGLVEKDGICTLPEEGEEISKTNGGKGGKIPSSTLVITKDCKSFKFGDKTGDAWWDKKGYKYAKQWVEKGYDDPLYIAFEMLKTSSSCFSEFPLKPEFNDYMSYEDALDEWISQHKEIWHLLWLIRNRIDINFFNGQTTVEVEIKNNKPVFSYGQGFDFPTFWEFIKPTLAYKLYMLGPDAQDPEMNSTLYLLGRILPNLSDAELTKLSSTWYNEGGLYSQIWDLTSDTLVGQSLDIEFP